MNRPVSAFWPIDDQLSADNPVAAAEAATTRSRGGSKPAGLGRFRQINFREKSGLCYGNQVLFQFLTGKPSQTFV